MRNLLRPPQYDKRLCNPLSHVLVGSVDLRVGPSLINRSNHHGLVIEMALNHSV
jgi:hypothetical protein